ncbi:hypothetical protein SAMN05216235_0488 [Salinicoccus halodurans]|uniref:Uncharacterized protein n=1 Tax=Salinicoccus halodurans TaxID=407035 RepID=A0AA94HCH0_9STAP|nr:hypothetical protein SAMN05216235_0488 [Salinicoccus halodurans]
MLEYRNIPALTARMHNNILYNKNLDVTTIGCHLI